MNNSANVMAFFLVNSSCVLHLLSVMQMLSKMVVWRVLEVAVSLDLLQICG